MFGKFNENQLNVATILQQKLLFTGEVPELTIDSLEEITFVNGKRKSQVFLSYFCRYLQVYANSLDRSARSPR